jgi:beta-mannosidase
VRIPESLEDYIYATQFIQAEALASAVRSWRRRWQGPGREYVAGALVWQLNDCWPVTSWAVVDYWRRPKPAYYALKREMAPLVLGLASPSAGGIEIWGVNALAVSVEGTVRAQCWTLDGQLLDEKQLPVVLAPNRARELGSVEFAGAGQCVYSAQLYLAEHIQARATLWPEPFKYLTLPDPLLTVEKLGHDRVCIQARRPAKGVWLSAAHPVKWSDNMLDLVPGQPQTITADGLGEARVEMRWLRR